MSYKHALLQLTEVVP